MALLASTPDVCLKVGGLMCYKSCGRTVESALRKVVGVEEARVVYELELACIWGTTDVASLIDAVECVGFDAEEGSCAALQLMPAVVLRVPDMMCMKSCGTMIQTALMQLAKTIEVQIDVPAKLVRIFGAVYPDECIQVLDAVGFEASQVQNGGQQPAKGEVDPLVDAHVDEEEQRMEESAGEDSFVLEIRGMSCASCTSKVERALRELDGVRDASVSLALSRAVVYIDEANLSTMASGDVIIRATEMVTDLGYEAECLTNVDFADMGSKASAEDIAKTQRMLTIAVVCTLPLLLVHLDWYPPSMKRPMDIFGFHVHKQIVLLFLLATPVQFIVGSRFYRNAWKNLQHGGMGMDLLVVVGTSLIYMYSTCLLVYAGCVGRDLAPHHVFFEASAMLITFITLGKYLEARAKAHTTKSITSLLSFQPQSVFRVDPATREETEIQISDLKRGDLVRVPPGARLPCDGVVEEGSSYVDESAITGESMPERKGKGLSVFGCTINQHGTLFVRATEVGSKSLIAQIVKLVSEAQMAKAPIQDFADRAAGYFTPAILFIALLTFVVWFSLALAGCVPKQWMEDDQDDPFLFSLLFAISVVAVMVGTGVAARNGVLIKGGDALELLSKAKAMILDKTGTLTSGRPVVVELATPEELMNGSESPATGVRKARALRTALAVERYSEHPLAHAVRVYASSYGVGLVDEGGQNCGIGEDSFAAEPGFGVMGRRMHDGVAVCCGNEALMDRYNIDVPDEVVQHLGKLRRSGMTSVCIAEEKAGLLGVIAIADPVKADAERAVAALRKAGVHLYMCTGDHEAVAIDVAEKVGIDANNVFSGCLPPDKLQVIKNLQGTHGVVAMVGDGINDAPPLAQADVGVAIGAGTAVAIDAASVILIRDKLTDLVAALHLSQTVYRRIQLNFAFAVFYNIIGVPLACGLFYPLMRFRLPAAYAGLAMSMSSVLVVCSSLLLHSYQSPAVLPNGDLQVPGVVKYLLCAAGWLLPGKVATEAMAQLSTARRNGYSHLPTEAEES